MKIDSAYAPVWFHRSSIAWQQVVEDAMGLQLLRSDVLPVVLVCLVTIVALGLRMVWRGYTSASRSKTTATPASPSPPSKDDMYSEEAYTNITPAKDFDLASTPPLQLRPFKPKYHMTMAIESTTLSDLVAMDNTFASRCAIRSALVATERHEVLACNPKGVAAVLELYTWLTGTYLPARYPSVYATEYPNLRNRVTGALLPLHLTDATVDAAERALALLGANVDDEFLLLLPSSKLEDEGKYRLEAFVNCFPSGFNTRSKLGLLLNEIHGPVPGYAARLEKSMDRYFASMPVGKIVKRANWSISTNGDLFCLKGNHMNEEEMQGREAGAEADEVDLEKTVLRCERQTLHRLPESRALVFAFKTYQYPIRELRDEGSGEILAEAIDGLGKGNAPGITVYKRQVVWGEKVKAFLRAGIKS